MDENIAKDHLYPASGTEISALAASSLCRAWMENNTRQGDMADQARAITKCILPLLKQTDARFCRRRGSAPKRIDKGTYVQA